MQGLAAYLVLCPRGLHAGRNAHLPACLPACARWHQTLCVEACLRPPSQPGFRPQPCIASWTYCVFSARALPPLQAIGRICDISQDLLGATVLAWGEAVPELAATLTLARQGQGRGVGWAVRCVAGEGCCGPE